MFTKRGRWNLQAVKKSEDFRHEKLRDYLPGAPSILIEKIEHNLFKLRPEFESSWEHLTRSPNITSQVPGDHLKPIAFTET